MKCACVAIVPLNISISNLFCHFPLCSGVKVARNQSKSIITQPFTSRVPTKHQYSWYSRMFTPRFRWIRWYDYILYIDPSPFQAKYLWNKAPNKQSFNPASNNSSKYQTAETFSSPLQMGVSLIPARSRAAALCAAAAAAAEAACDCYFHHSVWYPGIVSGNSNQIW